MPNGGVAPRGSTNDDDADAA